MTHQEPQNWFDAYSTCLASGGHLAVINGPEEAEYIRRTYKEIGERRIPTNDVAFVGFSDLFQRHHYRTVHGKVFCKFCLSLNICKLGTLSRKAAECRQTLYFLGVNPEAGLQS